MELVIYRKSERKREGLCLFQKERERKSERERERERVCVRVIFIVCVLQIERDQCGSE